jgi:hypothetical protein
LIDCDLPENNVCEIELDLGPYGLHKGVYGSNGILYLLWPYHDHPPFNFEYEHETGWLYIILDEVIK